MALETFQQIEIYPCWGVRSHHASFIYESVTL